MKFTTERLRCPIGARRSLVLMLGLAGAVRLFAAGPAQIALSHRALWPEAVDSPAAFDRASRAEILSFSAVLDEHARDESPALAAWLSLKSVNVASIERWRGETQQRLLDNYRHAALSCTANDFACADIHTAAELHAAALRFAEMLPDSHRGWFFDAQQFHRLYALELTRLAALFPKPSSEILSFNPSESAGWEFPDREFLLTFDDGPTLRGGQSDALLGAIQPLGLHTQFFLLGDALTARLRQESPAQLQARYDGQCVASHGTSHTSHQNRPDWQESIMQSSALIRATFGDNYRAQFRPPYGQRKADSGEFFNLQKLGVVLWNIDSQDWNAHISAIEAGDRVLSLMLLWRRGTILFHDVHDKAKNAVPRIVTQTSRAGLHWRDCREAPI